MEYDEQETSLSPSLDELIRFDDEFVGKDPSG